MSKNNKSCYPLETDKDSIKTSITEKGRSVGIMQRGKAKILRLVFAFEATDVYLDIVS